MKVRANADTPLDAETARNFGAEGIGLCRTEHMFFEGDRIVAVREMILSDDENGPPRRAGETAADAARGLRRAVQDHERPAGDDPAARSAAARVPAAHRSGDRRRSRTRSERRWTSCSAGPAELHEFNPMLGFRGCRLAIAYPEIAEMQARAIFEAAVEAARAQRRAGRAGDHGAAGDDQDRARPREGAHRRDGARRSRRKRA